MQERFKEIKEVEGLATMGVTEKYSREKHCGFGKSIWELDELEEQNWKKINNGNSKESEDQDSG